MIRFDIDVEVYGKQTECKCPRCGKKHMRKINWTGRGIPRKFCGVCDAMIGDFESGDFGGIGAYGHTARAVASVVR